MEDFALNSVYFATFLTFVTYGIGMFLKKKLRLRILNAMLISIGLSIAVVVLLKVKFTVYQNSARYLNYFLTPATVCLAVPLYEQFQTLKQNWKAILGGIIAGVLTNLVLVLGMCVVLSVGHKEYVSILPKSITTAIGLALSQEMGGIVPITMAMIIITGNLGNIFAEVLCRLFRIKDPVARGIAVGTSSHVLGTTKAMEMGQVEGAMSSLSIAVAGILTVVGASIFAPLL